jgi:hypothetical protein
MTVLVVHHNPLHIRICPFYTAKARYSKMKAKRALKNQRQFHTAKFQNFEEHREKFQKVKTTINQ